jgi:hypothetical protein
MCPRAAAAAAAPGPLAQTMVKNEYFFYLRPKLDPCLSSSSPTAVMENELCCLIRDDELSDLFVLHHRVGHFDVEH